MTLIKTKLNIYTFIIPVPPESPQSPSVHIVIGKSLDEAVKAVPGGNMVLVMTKSFNDIVDNAQRHFDKVQDVSDLHIAEPEPKVVKRNKQETANFLKVVRDKYGSRHISSIIKELEK